MMIHTNEIKFISNVFTNFSVVDVVCVCSIVVADIKIIKKGKREIFGTKVGGVG